MKSAQAMQESRRKLELEEAKKNRASKTAKGDFVTDFSCPYAVVLPTAAKNDKTKTLVHLYITTLTPK